MKKHTLPAIAPARRGSALLDAIGGQLQTVPSAVSSHPATTSQVEPVVRVKPEAFLLRLSPEVFRQIDKAAISRGLTMTVVIAQALKDAGFLVPDEDLVDRRKRRFRDG